MTGWTEILCKAGATLGGRVCCEQRPNGQDSSLCKTYLCICSWARQKWAAAWNRGHAGGRKRALLLGYVADKYVHNLC